MMCTLCKMNIYRYFDFELDKRFSLCRNKLIIVQILITYFHPKYSYSVMNSPLKPEVFHIKTMAGLGIISTLTQSNLHLKFETENA